MYRISAGHPGLIRSSGIIVGREGVHTADDRCRGTGVSTSSCCTVAASSASSTIATATCAATAVALGKRMQNTKRCQIVVLSQHKATRKREYHKKHYYRNCIFEIHV